MQRTFLFLPSTPAIFADMSSLWKNLLFVVTNKTNQLITVAVVTLVIIFNLQDYYKTTELVRNNLLSKSRLVHTTLSAELQSSSRYLSEFKSEIEARLKGTSSIIQRMYKRNTISDSTLILLARTTNISHIFLWNQDVNLLVDVQTGAKKFSDKIEEDILMEANRMLGESGADFFELFNVDEDHVFSGYANFITPTTKLILITDVGYFFSLQQKIGYDRFVQNFYEDESISFISFSDSEQVLVNLPDSIRITKHDHKVFNLLDNMSADSLLTEYRDTSSTPYFISYSKFQINDSPHYLKVGLNASELKGLGFIFWVKTVTFSMIGIFISISALSWISVRKKLQESLKEKEVIQKQTDTVFDQLEESVLVLNNDFTIQTVNTSFEKLSGRQKNELIGNSTGELHHDLSNVVKNMISERLSFWEWNFQDSEKRQKNFLIIYNATAPETSLHVFLFTDVTELRRLQQEIEDKKQLSAIGTLSAGIAHEVRNPINTIGMILQRLESETELKNNSENFEMITLAREEIQRVNKLVNEILQASKPRMNQFQTVNAGRLISQVISNLDQNLSGKNISVELEDHLEQINLKSDSLKLQQILENLILNSIQASHPNQTIKVKFRNSDSYFKFYICDYANGISPKNREKIFSAFFTTKKDGTGLGLFLVKQYVESLKGKIKIHSVENKGTVVSLTFPNIA